MPSTLYLIRHGATADNLLQPPRLQGRNDMPLDAVGVNQSKKTAQSVARIRFAACYCSPLRRAVQTAALIAPYLKPQPIDALIECDVGRWEGVDWDTIQRDDREAFNQYMADPGEVPYPGGESFGGVWARTQPVFEGLFQRHPQETFVVVSHHVVIRIFLALTLGLELRRARNVSLDNCGVSIVVADHQQRRVMTLNSTIHLS